jgi:crotonobetainyl-CoA:carnitine CoA-transferase CaiB-like acyl-CoA transferase
VLKREDLGKDPRFSDQAARANNREELTAALDVEFRKHSSKHWISVLAGILPVAPVFSLEEALESPFLKTNEMIASVPHPARPDMRVLSNPIKINGKRLSQEVCSPMGADTDTYVEQAASIRT